MESNDPLIQVYILTYNRPEYLLESLDSVLKQDYEDFTVVVSDNSTNDETEQLLREKSIPRFSYVRRNPSIPPLAHFNVVLSEVTSEYFMMFHDDDIMAPDCLATLSTRLDNNTDLAAVGGNASIFWNKNRISSGKFLGKKNQDKVLTTSEELARICLLFGELAPFPSYMYRRKTVTGLTLDPKQGGKYSDISFLMKILQKGNILWEGRPIMRYRKHTAQDSQGVGIKDALQLLRYILQHTEFSKKSKEVRFFRYKSWAGVIKGEYFLPGGRLSKYRKLKIQRAILRFSPFNIYLRLLFWRIWILLNKYKKI